MAFTVDTLNSCLRGELAAIDTYRQALEQGRSNCANDPKFQQLEKVMRDHEQAATLLQSLIRQKGGTPDTDSSAWGTLATQVTAVPKLLGDRTALKALKAGEESGINSYRSLIDGIDTPPDVRDAAMKLMRKDKEHSTRIDTMLETLATA